MNAMSLRSCVHHVPLPPKNCLAPKISRMFGGKVSGSKSAFHEFNQVVSIEGDSSTPLESISSLLEDDFVILTVVSKSR